MAKAKVKSAALNHVGGKPSLELVLHVEDGKSYDLAAIEKSEIELTLPVKPKPEAK